jgi:formylglycine-generating enzyme required for sulfatase activity
MKRPRFIAAQPIRKLVLPEGEEHRLMDYVMALGADPKRRDLMPKQEDMDRLWPVQDRLSLLIDLSIRRLCVTVDAGVGKSITLRQCEYLTQKAHPGHLALWMELSQMPANKLGFLHRKRIIKDEQREPLLVEIVESMLTAIDANHSYLRSGDSIADWLICLADRGDLTLIVDGVDQSSLSDADSQSEVLSGFMELCPNIRLLVAGRPYAIGRVAKNLGFENTGIEWHFCKIERFTEENVIEYLGASLHNEVRRLEADQQFLPRTLNIVRQMSVADMKQMLTSSDLYWYSVYKSLCETLENVDDDSPLKEWTTERCLRVISAVAFAMWCWKETPETRVPATDSDSIADFLKFMRTLGLDKRIAELDDKFTVLSDAILAIAQLNTEAVKLELYRSENRLESIQFADATIRDFFAAHWATNYYEANDDYGCDETKRILRSRTAKVIKYDAAGYGKDFSDFWKLASTMPTKLELPKIPEGSNLASYVHAISTLFELDDKSRPTELMWKAWPGLLRRAGFLTAMTTDEGEVQAATSKAQSWARRYHAGEELNSADNPASMLLLNFLIEYLALVKAKNPEVLMLEESLSASKVMTVPQGSFLYGDQAQVRQIETPFIMSAFQVWNDLYSLFDSHHKTSFDDYDKYSPYGRGACINTTWYDSWMFSLWSHSRLPSEQEWEAACRARVGDLNRKRHTEYCFGDGKMQLEEYAWFARNSPESEDSTNRRDHAHSVGRKKANAYGLHDVHGNVWEWTSDWYDQDRYFRCLRGGSFWDDALSTRCSRRYHYDPPYADAGSFNLGFRVARAAF